MKTGDTFSDPQERSYKVGLLLGRGLWGKTYRVQRVEDGGDFVLKCPLSAADLAGAAEPEQLAESCRQILREQAEFLGQGHYDFLPTLIEHFELEGGQPVLVLERFPTSLELRLRAGASFLEAVDLLIRGARLCQQLRDGPGVHGALRPGNILVDAEGSVSLSDVVTPTARRCLPALLTASPEAGCCLAPELASATGEPPFSVASDTYALGVMLWKAVLGTEANPQLPAGGPDKASLVALKDRLYARVKQEDSNPRFHARLSERLSATISRAISVKASPSPPYRFDRMDELLPRLQELRSLIRPEVDTVGRILLDRPANTTHFDTDEKVRFTVSVGCSPGVEQHKEIACGIAVFDRDSGERVREVPSTFDVSRHPSGRFRFQFEIGELKPGNYRVRAAFAIRDSGHEPTTKECELEIRAAHGYIPPPEEPPAGPLSLDARVREHHTVTEPMASVTLEQEPPSAPAPAPPPPAPAPPPVAKPALEPPPAAAPVPAPTPRPTQPFTAPEPAVRPAVVASPPVPVSIPIPGPSASPRPQVRPEPSRVPVTDERDKPTRRGSASTVSFSGDTMPASSGDTAVPIEEPPPTVAVPRSAVPKPGPRPALARAPEPRIEPEPAPRAPSGSWTELPLGNEPGDDITEIGDEHDELDEYRPKPPWLQLVDMIRGDPWAMFMAGATVIALILLIVLFLLRS